MGCSRTGPVCHFPNHDPVQGATSNHSKKYQQARTKRRQSVLDKHYSTWYDQYANVDRFFLIATPFLFLLFNIIYWFYFYVWDMMLSQINYDSDNNVEYITIDDSQAL